MTPSEILLAIIVGAFFGAVLAIYFNIRDVNRMIAEQDE